MSSTTPSEPTIDFQHLVNTYYQPLYRFAYSMSKNGDEASDLTQQTFYIWANKGSTLKTPAR